MSKPITASNRTRARKLLQDAAERLTDLKTERLQLSKETMDCITDAALKINFAQQEIEAQPSA